MKTLFRIFLWIMAIIGALCILSSLFSPEKEITKGERVGIVKISGFIADAEEAVAALSSFENDDEVKAVVVRVVSPGGVIAPSQEIHDAVKRLAEKKPVVASFGAVAASGGYYLAAPATKIVADSGSITGSIGVIMQFSDYEVLLDKIGMRSRALKSGQFKDAGSPFREMTEADRVVMQGVVDDLFAQFVDAVAQGRKMPREKVLALADGRIYSGRQAQKAGLVDELGGLREAVSAAGELGGLGDAPPVERWKRKKEGLLPLLIGEDAETVEKLAAPVGAPPARYLLPGW